MSNNIMQFIYRINLIFNLSKLLMNKIISVLYFVNNMRHFIEYVCIFEH